MDKSKRNGVKVKGSERKRGSKVNFDRCLLCQLDTVDPLQCPAKANSKRCYKSLAKNISKFSKLGYFTMDIDIILNYGNDIKTILVLNSASWHKSCH